MPPKRARKRKSPIKSSPASIYAYKEKLEDSNELEPSIRSVVANLMFTSGDDENPLDENEDFVVNILKNELIVFLEDVLAVHDNKLSHVKLEHMLPVLKGQQGILSRFIKYLKNRVEMATFMRAKTYSSNGVEQDIDVEDEDDKNQVVEDEVDPIDDIGDVGGEEGELLKKKRKKFGNLTFEENLLDEVKQAFSSAKMRFNSLENVVDEKHDQQTQALQIVIEDMSGDDYNKFASARRISFQVHSPITSIYSSLGFSSESRKRKRTIPRNNRQLLLSWLGNPPVHGEPAQVFLAFIAKEIISETVGAALVERRKMNPAEGGPLRHRFYEEPLRKNQRFRKYGRLLL